MELHRLTRRAPDLPPRPHLFLRIMPSPGSLPAILASVTGKYSLFPHAPTLSQKRTAHPAFWAIVSCRIHARRLSLSFTPSCTGLRRTFLRPSPPQLSYRCRPMGNKKDLYLLPDEGDTPNPAYERLSRRTVRSHTVNKPASANRSPQVGRLYPRLMTLFSISNHWIAKLFYQARLSSTLKDEFSK